NGSRQRHSSPSSLASGSSTDETGPPHRIPDSPFLRRIRPTRTTFPLRVSASARVQDASSSSIILPR
ncbi:hypothetical protein CN200_35020, partial [Sinorhizobium meliloti]